MAVVDLKDYDPDDHLVEEVGDWVLFSFSPDSPVGLTSCVPG